MFSLDTALLLGSIMATIIIGLASLPYLLPQPGKLENRKSNKKYPN